MEVFIIGGLECNVFVLVWEILLQPRGQGKLPLQAMLHARNMQYVPKRVLNLQTVIFLRQSKIRYGLPDSTIVLNGSDKFRNMYLHNKKVGF